MFKTLIGRLFGGRYYLVTVIDLFFGKIIRFDFITFTDLNAGRIGKRFGLKTVPK